MHSSNKSKFSYNIMFLAAISLVLATIDVSIPKPVPFLRIGLANLPILLALFLLPAREYFFLVFIKSLGMSIISGMLLSYVALFSFVGSFASAGIMWLFSKIFAEKISFLGLAIAGALASNSIQLLIARYLVFGTSVRFMVPLFIVAGLGSGIVLGLFSLQFAKKSQWLKNFAFQNRKNDCLPKEKFPDPKSVTVPEKPSRALSPVQLFSLLVMATVILANTLLVAIIGFLLAFAVNIYQAKKNQKKLPSLIMPILVIGGITLVHLLIPRGKVLIAPAGLPITETALFAGMKSGFFLEALIFLSKNTLDSNLTLPGKLGQGFAQLFNLYKLFFSIKPTIKQHSLIASIDEYLLTIEMRYAPNSLTHLTDNIIMNRQRGF